MGLACQCFITPIDPPTTFEPNVPFVINYLVEIMGRCEECSVRCNLPPQFGECVLDTTTVGPGETMVTATVTLLDCPPGQSPRTIVVAVNCEGEGATGCDVSAEVQVTCEETSG